MGFRGVDSESTNGEITAGARLVRFEVVAHGAPWFSRRRRSLAGRTFHVHLALSIELPSGDLTQLLTGEWPQWAGLRVSKGGLAYLLRCNLWRINIIC